MRTANAPTIERYLQDLCCQLSPSPDTDLLERYRQFGDPDAFAELVRRHGPLVLGACRRILGHTADAEDAFQATFLALLRSKSVRPGTTIAPWLYRVAVRTARHARRKQATIQTAHLESVAVERNPLDGLTVAELFRALDEELIRLPERLRSPLVLCYLDGRSRVEAAAILGWSLGTLKRRLDEGRRSLRLALERRGLSHRSVGHVGLAAAVSGDYLRPKVCSALMAELSRLAAGGAVPASVQALIGGSWFGASMTRNALAALILTGVCFGLIAVGGRTRSNGPAGIVSSSSAPDKQAAISHNDRFGDPLPAGALARLGTLRHRAANSTLAVTPDGKTVVAAGDGMVIRTFDATTGQSKATLSLSAPQTMNTTLSANARYLAGIAWEGRGLQWIGVWATAGGDRVARLELKQPAAALSLAPNRDRLAYIEGFHSFPPSPQRLCVWDFKSGKGPQILDTFIKKKDPRRSFGEQRTCFSADGTRLLAHQQDGYFCCWDLAKGKRLWAKELPYLKYFFFHPDGEHLVVAPKGTGYEIWKVADGTNIPERRWSGVDGQDKWSYWPVGISRDGKVVAFFQGQRRVILWDMKRNTAIATLDDPLRAKDEPAVGFWAVPTNFAFTPDGTGFAWRSSTVQYWSVKTGKPAWPATWDKGHTEAINNLCFTPDGASLVSTAEDSTVYVWELANAAPRLRLQKGFGGLLAISPDSKTLVISTGDRQSPLQGWDLATGKPSVTLRDAKECPEYGSSSDRHAVVSKDGKLMTATDNSLGGTFIPTGRYLTTWDLKSGKRIGRERIGSRTATNALSPAGDLVAIFETNRPNEGVRILATATGKETMHFSGVLTKSYRAGVVQCDMVFSPRRRFLATHCSINRHRGGAPAEAHDLQVWDLQTGKLLARIPVNDPVRFAFGADERSMVVATPDALGFFELSTRKIGHRIGMPRSAPSHPSSGFATALAVSPGGRTVATGHHDGTILLWDTRPGPLPALSRDNLEAAWATLKEADATRAYAAIWQFVDSPEFALSTIKSRLKPAVPVPEAVKLVKLLDSDDYKTREQAAAQLKALGKRAEPALWRAVKEPASLEMRLRAGRLLEPLEAAWPVDEEDRRHVRVVQILERIGSAQARRLLKDLAAGDAGARLTRYAREALSGLEGR
jgi:RNA polymerase sigma factor (sigma-70 family)